LEPKFCVHVPRKETSLAKTKKLTGCTYQVIPLVATYKYPLGSWILLLCYHHQRKAGNHMVRVSTAASVHHHSTLVAGGRAAGTKESKHDTAPAQDEKGTAAQHHSLLRCRPPWPARHIAESSTHGRGQAFNSRRRCVARAQKFPSPRGPPGRKAGPETATIREAIETECDATPTTLASSVPACFWCSKTDGGI